MEQYRSGANIGQTVNIDSSLGTEAEAQRFWTIVIALGIVLGDMAFVYSYSMILIDIQDPHRATRENRRMKRATVIGISAATFFYMAVGIVGYLAFGNKISIYGNVLQCFENPCWLVAIDFATACVVVHLIGAYQQVYNTQPVNQIVEMSVERRFPNNKWLSKSIFIRIPGLETFCLNLFASWRIIYVVTMTIISMMLPNFNDILGILRDIGFCAFTVYFPLTIYIRRHKIRRFSIQWIGLQILSFLTFLVLLAALIGYIEGIYIDVQHIRLFKAL